MQNIYETFEFNKIKEHILEYAKTELGKVYINELEMFPDRHSVENALLDLSEISSIIHNTSGENIFAKQTANAFQIFYVKRFNLSMHITKRYR